MIRPKFSKYLGWLVVLPMLFSGTQLYAQKTNLIEGVVIYVSSQNCYVKFLSTEGIEKGDTIFVSDNGLLKPALTVEYISSISCAGKPIKEVLKKGDKLLAKVEESKTKEDIRLKQETDRNLNEHPSLRKKNEEIATGNKQQITGRLSAISYLNLSNTQSKGYQKFRYNMSLQAANLGNTGLLFESFSSFTHRVGYWSEIQTDIFNGLKIYDLSLSYRFSNSTKLLVGRNINSKLSSMGAIDGLQFTTGYKQFCYGAVVGFRPNYSNYSFDKNLFEYGAYLGHKYSNDWKSIETTLAFMQQMNQGKIDRRFTYFQSNISMVKNLKVFVSSEIDLYRMTDSIASNTLSLTSIYLNLNYRPTKKLTLNASFDARKNVIYYETFKNYIEQLLEDATRQGLQFRINYKLASQIGVGANAGYRNRIGDLQASKTANIFASVYEMPFISGMFGVNANYISNSYLSGWVFSSNYSRDIIPQKLNANIEFRYIDYAVLNKLDKSKQYIGELGLYWQIAGKLSLSATYEATFDSQNQWNIFYFNLSQRF